MSLYYFRDATPSFSREGQHFRSGTTTDTNSFTTCNRQTHSTVQTPQARAQALQESIVRIKNATRTPAMVSKIFRDRRDAEKYTLRRLNGLNSSKIFLRNRIQRPKFSKTANRFITVQDEDTHTANNIQLLPAKARNGLRKRRPVQDAEFDHERQGSHTLNFPDSFNIYLVCCSGAGVAKLPKRSASGPV
jgi:hypothetical protein